MIEPAILYILSINNQCNAILSVGDNNEFFTFNWTKGLQNTNAIDFEDDDEKTTKAVLNIQLHIIFVIGKRACLKCF